MAENKGTWIDNKTGKVVNSQPEEGVQLVSPNVEANPNDEAAVQRAKDNLAAEAEAANAPATTASTDSTAGKRSTSK